MSRVIVLPVVMALLLAGCQTRHASPTKPQPICAGGDMMMQTTLWFGLSKPDGGRVSSLDWMNFVDNEVTPRLKAGLSVYDAKGQWLGENGKLARENSKALMLIHGIDHATNQDIEALRNLYKKRFDQESVMRVDAPVCVGF